MLRGGHLVDYLAAVGGEPGVRPAEGDAVLGPDGQSFTWTKHASTSDAMDYEDVFGVPYSDSWPYNFIVMYAYTTINSTAGGTAFLEIGTEDSGRAYLNGKLVHDAHVRHCLMDRDFVPVELQKGENTLLIKVENCGGPTAFIARFIKEPPRYLARLSRDEQDSGDKHEGLCVFLNEQGCNWVVTGTADGGALVYSVYPEQYEGAQQALLRAVESGHVRATSAG